MSVLPTPYSQVLQNLAELIPPALDGKWLRTASGMIELADAPTNTDPLILGTGGPRIKNSSGTIQFRNNPDNADAPITVSTVSVNGAVLSYNNPYVSILAPTTGRTFLADNCQRMWVQNVGDIWLEASSSKLGVPSTIPIGWCTSATNASGSLECGFARQSAGLVDVRADNGLRVRNWANGAFAPLQCGNLTAGTDMVVVDSGPNTVTVKSSTRFLDAPGASYQLYSDGATLTASKAFQFSSTSSVFGTVDAKLTRPSTGLVQVQADNGLSIKNLAGSAFAPISAISGTFNDTSVAVSVSTGGVIRASSGTGYSSDFRYDYLGLYSVGAVTWSTGNNGFNTVDAKLLRGGTGLVAVRADNGLEVKNLAGSAFAPIQGQTLTLTNAVFTAVIDDTGAKFPQGVSHDANNWYALSSQGLKLHSGGKISFFPAATILGSGDIDITRPSSGLLRVSADNGLEVKNLAGSAWSALQAGITTITNPAVMGGADRALVVKVGSGSSVNVHGISLEDTAGNVYVGIRPGAAIVAMDGFRCFGSPGPTSEAASIRHAWGVRLTDQLIGWAGAGGNIYVSRTALTEESAGVLEINNGTKVASGGSYGGLNVGTSTIGRGTAGSGNVANGAVVYTTTDPNNTATSAVYVEPVTNLSRLFFGSGSKKWYVNFTNCLGLENVPGFVTVDSMAWGVQAPVGAGIYRPTGSDSVSYNSSGGTSAGHKFYAYSAGYVAPSASNLLANIRPPAASIPGFDFVGTWFTGGTATTTKPAVLIEPTGTTSTGWSPSGTGLGINATAVFAGNFIDAQLNGVPQAVLTKDDQVGGELRFYINGALNAQFSAARGYRTKQTQILARYSGADPWGGSVGVVECSSGGLWTTKGDLGLEVKNLAGSAFTQVLAQTFTTVDSGYKTERFGRNAGTSTAQGNTFIGQEAGLNVTSGTNNTFVGLQAGYGCTTGTNNVVVGAQTVLSAGAFSVIAIGYGSSVTSSVTPVSIGAGQTISHNDGIGLGTYATTVKNGQLVTGRRIDFWTMQGYSSTSTDRPVCEIERAWADSTDASRKGRMMFHVYDATTTREGIRIESTGSAARVGIGGAVDSTALLMVNGITNITIASSSDSPSNAPLTIRNSSSTVGTTTGLWAFGIGHPGSYDGNLKIVGPLQTSLNQWTLQFQDHATASQRGISTPGWMSATQFRSTVVGLGDVELLSWNGTGANYNGTTRVGLNHPYGTHPVELVISRASGHASNTAGTKFYIIDGDGTEFFSVSNESQVVIGSRVALATNATKGFMYVPTCAGTPVGTPTSVTDKVPVVVDTTNNKLYFYSSGWQDTSGQTSEVVYTPSGTTQTIPLNTKHQTLDLASTSGNPTITLTVPALSGQAGTIIIKQHGTTPRSITWAVSSGTISWLGTEPTWSGDGVGKVRVVSWRWNGSVMYLASTESN